MPSEKTLQELKHDIEVILGSRGVLSRTMDVFDHREGQIDMARAVAEAVLYKSPYAIEAGTGTGKTIAYLIPLLLTGVRAVISTGTKTLQEQIFKKDIPNLAAALNIPIKAAIMKGRSNYLCRYRYEGYRRSLDDSFFDDEHWDMIEEWLSRTTTGDRGELVDLPDDYRAWNSIAALPDTCIGQRCPHIGDCYLMKRNRLAEAADIIVVNHHLFFADLALREGDSNSRVLPDYETVVFDEAHQVESVATQYFGVGISSGQLVWLVEDFKRLMDRAIALGVEPGDVLEKAVIKWTRHINGFVAPWVNPPGQRRGAASSGRVKLDHEQLDMQDEARLARLYSALEGVSSAAQQVAERIAVKMGNAMTDEHSSVIDDLKALARRAVRARAETGAVFEPDAETQQRMVFFYERGRRRVSWGCHPILVADLLQQTLFTMEKGQVFTSATLATGGDFAYFSSQIGLPEGTPGIIIPSPYYTDDKVVMYVPRDMPLPSAPNFGEAAGRRLADIITMTGGGVLGLFTSYFNLRAATAYLREHMDVELLVQGEGSPPRLLEQFRRNRDSVLLATGTFWEGVDVAGESLRAVVIDKLPFDPPNDPFTEARITYLRRREEEPFYTYQIPRAIIALKQGLGRLLRGPADSGLWAVLDQRLVQKNYGRTVMKSLPGVKVMYNLDETALWWQKRTEKVRRSVLSVDDGESKLH